MRKSQNIVVLGASDNPERYSNMAVKLLLEHKYNVIPVHPILDTIENVPVQHSLKEINAEVHTLSVYLSPKTSEQLIDDIVTLHPQRVILNPNTESELLESELKKNNISYIKACTLVLLRTGQF